MCPHSTDNHLLLSIALVAFATSTRSDRERPEPCRAASLATSVSPGERVPAREPTQPSTKPPPPIEEPRASPRHYAFDRTYPDLRALVHDVESFTGRRFVVGSRVRNNIEARIRSRVMPDTASFYQAFLSLLGPECIGVVPSGSNLLVLEGSCGSARLAEYGARRTCAQVASSPVWQTAEIVQLHRVAGSDVERVARSMLSTDGDATAVRGSRTLIVTDADENAGCIVALVERIDDAEP